MIECTDCKWELEEDETIHVSYEITTDTGIRVMEIELPLCIDCTVKREALLKKRKRKKRDSVR